MNTIGFDKKVMKNALALLNKAAQRRPTLPILEYALIEQDTHTTRLTVCNLTTTNQTWTRVIIPTDQTTHPTQPAPHAIAHLAELRDAISSMEQPFIAIGTGDNPAVTVYEGGKYPRVAIINSLSLAEFPPFPQRKMTDTLWLERGFSTAVKETYPAASNDIARPILTHLHVKEKEGTLIVEAANGFMLTRIDTKMVTLPGINFLIPALASKLIATRQLPCNITIGTGNDYFFYSDNDGNYAGLDIAAFIDIGNHYPDIDQIIRRLQNTDTRILFMPESWTPLLKAAVKACKQANTSCIVRITVNNDVHLDTPELKMSAELPASILNVGKTPVIGINPAFLETVLSNLDPEKPLSMNWDAPVTPMTIHGEDITALIMPVYMDDKQWEKQ